MKSKNKSKNKKKKSNNKKINHYRQFVFGKTKKSNEIRKKLEKDFIKKYGVPEGKNILKKNSYLVKKMAELWKEKKTER